MALVSTRLRGNSRRDPFALNEPAFSFSLTKRDTTGRTARNTAINPAQRTLIAILAGQSLNAGNNPTLYVPTNTASIDNFNLYDGSSYPVTDVVLGGYGTAGGAGIGNHNVRVYDTLITNGKFDRVIFGCIAIGGTSILDYAAGGVYADRIAVMMRRLAWRGYAPGMTGTSWLIDYMIGETDNQLGTSQAAFTAGMASANALAAAAGFAGTIIVNQDTMISNATSAAIRAAQAASVGGSVKLGGDIDTLTGGSNRQADGTHLTDVGAAAAATLKYNAYLAAGLFS